MVALLHMTLLAWDRHEAIVNPLKYSSSNKKLRIGISLAVTYVASYGMVFGFILAMRRPTSYGCYFSSSLSFFWPFTMLAFVTPFVSMFVFYIRCAFALHRQFRKLHPAVLRVLNPQQQSTRTWKELFTINSAARKLRGWISEQSFEPSQDTQAVSFTYGM
jgi:hypothetical protein